MNENLKHGAVHTPIRRWFHRKARKASGKRLGKGMGVNWEQGSRFRNKWEGKVSIKNQADNFSCSGQAGSYGLQIDRLIRDIYDGEISAKSIYAPIAYPSGGTTISSLMQQIGTVGANLEREIPSYDIYGNPLSESMMIERSWETPETTKSALTRAGYTPYDIDDDIDSVADAINTYGWAIIEIQGQNGNTPPWNSATPQPPNSNNSNEKWWHFMVVMDFSIDNGKKRIHAFQSEGPTWGDKGMQYLYENYFNGKFIDAFTFIYDTEVEPTNTNHSIWAEISRWFRNIYIPSLKTA